MKTDKLLHLLQQKKFMRSGGALPLPKAQIGKITDPYIGMRKFYDDAYNALEKYENKQGEVSPFNVSRAWAKAAVKNPHLLFRDRHSLSEQGFSEDQITSAAENPYHKDSPVIRMSDTETKHQYPTDYVVPNEKDVERYNRYIANQTQQKSSKGNGFDLSDEWKDIKRGVRNASRDVRHFIGKEIPRALRNCVNGDCYEFHQQGGLAKAQSGKPYLTSDLEDFNKRTQAYNDSLALYKNYKKPPLGYIPISQSNSVAAKDFKQSYSRRKEDTKGFYYSPNGSSSGNEAIVYYGVPPKKPVQPVELNKVKHPLTQGSYDPMPIFDLMMPDGNRMKKDDFINNYGEAAWLKATRQKYQTGGGLTKAQNGKASNFLQPNNSKLKEGYNIPSRYPSTELAISIGGEDGEPAYLIPSFKYGHILRNPGDEFYNTGDYIGGPFKTWQEADKWDIEVRHPYVEKGQPIPSPLKWWGEGYRKGGLTKAQVGKPIYTNDPNDPSLKAYQDSSRVALNAFEKAQFERNFVKQNIQKADSLLSKHLNLAEKGLLYAYQQAHGHPSYKPEYKEEYKTPAQAATIFNNYSNASVYNASSIKETFKDDETNFQPVGFYSIGDPSYQESESLDLKTIDKLLKDYSIPESYREYIKFEKNLAQKNNRRSDIRVSIPKYIDWLEQKPIFGYHLNNFYSFNEHFKFPTNKVIYTPAESNSVNSNSVNSNTNIDIPTYPVQPNMNKIPMRGMPQVGSRIEGALQLPLKDSYDFDPKGFGAGQGAYIKTDKKGNKRQLTEGEYYQMKNPRMSLPMYGKYQEGGGLSDQLFQKYYGQVAATDRDKDGNDLQGYDYFYSQVPELQALNSTDRSILIDRLMNFMHHPLNPNVAVNPNELNYSNLYTTPQEIDKSIRQDNYKLKLNKNLTPKQPMTFDEYQRGGLAKAQLGIPSVATANQQAIQNAGTPYLNRAMVQAVLANASQPVTNTLGKVVSTPASREKERREKVVANDPSQYSVMPGFQSDYNLGIKEPGADNSVLSDPIAMAAALTAGGVGLGAYGLSQVPRMFLGNLASEATVGLTDVGKYLTRNTALKNAQQELSRSNKDALTFSQSAANKAKLQEFRPNQNFSVSNQQARFTNDVEAQKLYESYRLENDPNVSIEQYLGDNNGRYGARDYGDMNDIVVVNPKFNTTYEDALHETTHSRSIRLRATDAEKEIASEAWLPMLKKHENAFSMPEEEAFAVQNELRLDKLKDLKGNKVYTEKDIPKIKKGLQDMINEPHPYLKGVNIEDFDMSALLKSLNKIGLGAVVSTAIVEGALQQKKQGGVTYKVKINKPK